MSLAAALASPGVLFTLGTIVFFFGALGLLLVGLEVFDRWRISEKQSDEDTYLDDETVGQAITDPRNHRH